MGHVSYQRVNRHLFLFRTLADELTNQSDDFYECCSKIGEPVNFSHGSGNSVYNFMIFDVLLDNYFTFVHSTDRLRIRVGSPVFRTRPFPVRETSDRIGGCRFANFTADRRK